MFTGGQAQLGYPGTPPIIDNGPLSNTTATLNSIYHPIDPSIFTIENFALNPAFAAGDNPCAGMLAPTLATYMVKQKYQDGSTNAVQHIERQHMDPLAPDKSTYIVPETQIFGPEVGKALAFQAVVALNAATFQNPDKVETLYDKKGQVTGYAYQRTFVAGTPMDAGLYKFKVVGTM